MFIGALGRKRLCTNDIENSKKKKWFTLLFFYSDIATTLDDFT